MSLTGAHTVDIAGRPTVAEKFVLGLLVLVLPVAALVGWLVSRIGPWRGGGSPPRRRWS